MLKTRIIIALLIVFVLPTILAQEVMPPSKRSIAPILAQPRLVNLTDYAFQIFSPPLQDHYYRAAPILAEEEGRLRLVNFTSYAYDQLPILAYRISEEDAPVTTNPNRTITEIYLSLAILLFGMILAIMEILVVIKKGTGWDIESVRLLGITLVITIGAFLIPAGYSSEQITPLVALLGTIVGYLLGRDRSPPQSAG